MDRSEPRPRAAAAEIPASRRFLHLSTLSGFAVAQPLFDLLARHVPFLIFHQVEGPELYLLAAGLVFLPPAAALALELTGRWIHPGLGEVIGAGTTALLVLLFVAPLLKRVRLDRSFLLLPLAALAAYGFTRAYRRSAGLRSFLAMLSPSALVFLGVFLSSSSVRSLAAPPPVAPPPVAHSAEVRASTAPPLVFVIFDGLPLVSLLDADSRIDPELYPNFAALAREATWFRNATTNWTYTTAAVATMLTGRRDDAKRPPTLAEYPRNLFTLLSETHEPHAIEAVTWMAPARASAAADASPPPREGALLPDLAMVYLNVVSPVDFARWLPEVREHWGGFQKRDLLHIGDLGDRPTGELVYRNPRGEIVARFIASLAPSARPRLDYLHSTLPHRPLCFLPSGRLYGQRRTLRINGEFGWRGGRQDALEIHQRHLLQLVYTDRLLGDLVAALEERGLYDASALVITSDHGESFVGGFASRLPSQTPHPEDILRIPLLIKAPGQRVGAVSDVSVRTIDVLPTVADLLGVEVPWEVEGRSALDPEAVPYYLETTIEDSNGDRMTFPGDLPFDEESLRRKLELFDPRWGGVERLYRIGPHAELVGVEVATLAAPADAPCALDLDQKAYLEDYRPADGGYVPARFTGRIGCPELAGEVVALAMAVHGKIGAVPEVVLDDGGWGVFSALVPEAWITEGGNPVAFFLVRGAPRQPRFERVTVR